MFPMDFIFSYILERVPFHQVSGSFSSLAEKPLLSASSGATRPPLSVSWRPSWFPFSLFSTSFQVPPASWLKGTPTCFSFLFFVDTHHCEYQYVCQLFSAARKTTSEASGSKQHLFCSQICIGQSSVRPAHFFSTWHQLG